MARDDSKTLTILHVEDDENDALLLRKACERAKIPVRVHHASGVAAAIHYLSGDGEYSDRTLFPLPHVIILDLRLAGESGWDCLRWIRAQAGFQRVPVLVFTASLSKDDKSKAMHEGANAYFVKPASFESLVQLVGCLEAAGQPRLN